MGASTALATLEQAEEMGLLASEFELIEELLGRTPNFTEMCIYSVMWSEHCSYKNSIKWLKTLPKEGPHMLVKAGEENAGIVDIGDGIGCAFKIESHNHPSALEPYQGAATGVGGINRDIFTMGARPIAQLNSLRFGDLDEDKTRWLLDGVVRGIADYGNSFGVPVVGGEVFFDEVYHTNPLVNAMSVGLLKSDRIISAKAGGPGNPVFIVGSATGKDGIQGASFASKDISADSANDLPAVQVGDPFQEKLLLEASLELAAGDAVVGMQDMGAAGITCSTSEMSAGGGVGMDIQLDLVPTRQADMQPYEILLSESQERMLVVVKKGQEAEIKAVFDKWDLHAVEIGVVTEGDTLRYFDGDELVGELSADSLVLGGGAPVYDRETREPGYLKDIAEYSIDDIPEPDDYVAAARELLAQPNIASKRWVYEQYDSMVGTANRSTNRPGDAAVVQVKGSKKGLALSVDCNARYVEADPHRGCAIAVAEAARNIACVGAQPSAITNCLNFGNPYNPEVYWQFVGAIKGMSEACLAFNTPVTGGNVSFYNQTSNEQGEPMPVYPTPTIGMLGLLEDVDLQMTSDFKEKGHLIYLLGDSHNDLGCSEYLVALHEVRYSSAPHFDLDSEVKLHEGVRTLIDRAHITGAHDVSDGGVMACLVEMGAPRALGFDVESDGDVRLDAFLFGEAQGRILVTTTDDLEGKMIDSLTEAGVPFTLLGHVTRGKCCVDGVKYGYINDLSSVIESTIPAAMAH
ncbi:MAG: phosphoribosylformylglycinamidine synthase subunit PurL [Flavobacteriales bacterium]|nr:phosphoribosylformylglycinamidine synthase subunit PurL [Flavobacteriales bacterium]